MGTPTEVERAHIAALRRFRALIMDQVQWADDQIAEIEQNAADRTDQCPTCTYPIRETAGLQCQTCGRDYSKGEKPA